MKRSEHIIKLGVELEKEYNKRIDEFGEMYLTTTECKLLMFHLSVLELKYHFWIAFEKLFKL